METQSRFNLNAPLENWRNELAAQPQLSPDDRRELEKHLADSMAELRQRGLAEEEAFWLARRRMGSSQQLAEEFEKADPLKVWRERAFWMVAAVLASQIWSDFSYASLRLLSDYLMPHFVLYSLYPLPLIVVGVLPFVLALVLVARGYLNRASEKFLAIVNSQVKLAFIAVLLVFFSSLLVGWMTQTARKQFPALHDPLFTLTTQNMMVPLIFVPLLCLLMPKKPKISNRI